MFDSLTQNIKLDTTDENIFYELHHVSLDFTKVKPLVQSFCASVMNLSE